MGEPGPSKKATFHHHSTSPSVTSNDKKTFFRHLYSIEAIAEKETGSGDSDNPIAEFLRNCQRRGKHQQTSEKPNSQPNSPQSTSRPPIGHSHSPIGSRKLGESRGSTLSRRETRPPLSPPSPMTPKRRIPAIPLSSPSKTQGRTPPTSTPIPVVGINPRPTVKAKPKKGKKEPKVVLAPESRRLFKGMTFCKVSVRI